jgi:hypothetical protein
MTSPNDPSSKSEINVMSLNLLLIASIILEQSWSPLHAQLAACNTPRDASRFTAHSMALLTLPSSEAGTCTTA